MNMMWISWTLLLSCLFGNGYAQIQHGNLEDLATANNVFATGLYKQLSSNSSSFIFSPLSISTAFTMLYLGARGNTYSELNSTLGFHTSNMSREELLDNYGRLISTLAAKHDYYEFAVANGQFIHAGFPVNRNYTRLLTEDFKAESRLLDFSNTTATLHTVNEWAKNKTKGKIQDLLKELNDNDVMVLLNAVYFKGEWMTKFDERVTYPFDFYTEYGVTKQVRMMNGDIPCKYGRDHPIGGEVLELPYKGGHFSMIFILPQRGQNISSLEVGLTAEAIHTISDDLNEQNVTVGIPKMKIESDFDLKTQLPSLGIRDVFTDAADLSGISRLHLKVSQAVHKAVLEVTEEGAEAAAATAVVTMTRSGTHRPRFWANRPFMFFIRHNPTKTLCFMGKVVDV